MRNLFFPFASGVSAPIIFAVRLVCDVRDWELLIAEPISNPRESHAEQVHACRIGLEYAGLLRLEAKVRKLAGHVSRSSITHLFYYWVWLHDSHTASTDKTVFERLTLFNFSVGRFDFAKCVELADDQEQWEGLAR